MIQDKKIKVYLNGKLLRKKIIITDHGWSFVRPLNITKDDRLSWTWSRKI